MYGMVRSTFDSFSVISSMSTLMCNYNVILVYHSACINDDTLLAFVFLNVSRILLHVFNQHL